MFFAASVLNNKFRLNNQSQHLKTFINPILIMAWANKIGTWGGKMTQGLAIAIKMGVTKKGF